MGERKFAEAKVLAEEAADVLVFMLRKIGLDAHVVVCVGVTHPASPAEKYAFQRAAGKRCGACAAKLTIMATLDHMRDRDGVHEAGEPEDGFARVAKVEAVKRAAELLVPEMFGDGQLSREVGGG